MNLHSQNQTTIVGLMSFKNGRHLKVNKQKTSLYPSVKSVPVPEIRYVRFNFREERDFLPFLASVGVYRSLIADWICVSGKIDELLYQAFPPLLGQSHSILILVHFLRLGNLQKKKKGSFCSQYWRFRIYSYLVSSEGLGFCNSNRHEQRKFLCNNPLLR